MYTIHTKSQKRIKKKKIWIDVLKNQKVKKLERLNLFN